MNALRLFLLLACGARLACAAIRITGSDLLGPAFSAELQAYARRAEIELTLDLAGSHAGWEALRAGRADMALLSFPPGATMPSAPYYCAPLAYHTAVVLVPATLPLEQISFEQLAGIFGLGTQAGLRRWGELGLTGEWSARPVAPLAIADREGLAQALFRHAVLADGAFQPAVSEFDAVDDLLARLTKVEGSIALAGVAIQGDAPVKALLIARDDRAVAYAPTPEAIHRGDYPLRWPVYVVFRRTDAPRLFALLRHILGDDVAEKLTQAGLTPVPREARNAQIFDLEQM